MEQLLSYASENSGASSSGSGIWYIIMAVGLWKMFEKAGEPGWIGFIPFYNQYKLCEKVMNNPWYWVRLFIVIVPIVGWFMYFYFAYQMQQPVQLLRTVRRRRRAYRRGSSGQDSRFRRSRETA